MSISAKVLEIYAHSRDCNGVYVRDGEGNEIVLADGHYVPFGIGIGGGDSVELTIDIETGKVVGWDPEKFKRGLATLVETKHRQEEEEEDD